MALKLEILLDISTKINIITRKIIKDAKLTIRQWPKLKLILYISHSQIFLGLCENVEIII